jgi:hypothetical protein
MTYLQDAVAAQQGGKPGQTQQCGAGLGLRIKCPDRLNSYAATDFSMTFVGALTAGSVVAGARGAVRATARCACNSLNGACQ